MDGEFGTEVVRIIITASMDQESHDTFLAELHSIWYCNISYDLVNKLGKNLERGIQSSPAIVKKSDSTSLKAILREQGCKQCKVYTLFPLNLAPL